MDLETARQHIGAKVIYHTTDGSPDEQGVITSTGVSVVFVRYGVDPGTRATRPGNLTLVADPAWDRVDEHDTHTEDSLALAAADHMPALEDVSLAACPLPSCHRGFVSMPGPAEQPGALADVFGWGVMAATARHQRLTDHEREIRDHLNTHTASEWAIALAAATRQIRELEAASVTT